MDITERAYASGMEEVFNANGLTKRASHNTARLIAKLTKKASLISFGGEGGGFSLSSLILPLIAAGGAGYIAYNAGQQGSKRKSAYANIKDYLGRSLSNIIRNTKPIALHDYVANTHY